MTDEPRGEGYSPKRWAHLIREAEHRAMLIREGVRLKRCAGCGGFIITPGLDRHAACQRDTLMGKTCTCPSGCSTTRYGNGPVDCDPGCVPCSILRGATLAGGRRK